MIIDRYPAPPEVLLTRIITTRKGLLIQAIKSVFHLIRIAIAVRRHFILLR